MFCLFFVVFSSPASLVFFLPLCPQHLSVHPAVFNSLIRSCPNTPAHTPTHTSVWPFVLFPSTSPSSIHLHQIMFSSCPVRSITQQRNWQTLVSLSNKGQTSVELKLLYLLVFWFWWFSCSNSGDELWLSQRFWGLHHMSLWYYFH